MRVAVLALRNIAEGVEGAMRARRGGAETLPDPVQIHVERWRRRRRLDLARARGAGRGGAEAHRGEPQLKGFADEELAGALVDLEEGVLVPQGGEPWERYRAEPLSGSLTWAAAHTDEGFTRTAAATENNCQLLRVLVKIMEARQPHSGGGVHDLGEFATHPRGSCSWRRHGREGTRHAAVTHHDAGRKQGCGTWSNSVHRTNGGGSDAATAGMASA